MSPHDPAERVFAPHAAVLGWLWPGLGHIVLGHRRRGLLIMAGVLFLVGGGVLIGGVDCVDRRNDRLWFLAQSLCGPLVFAIDQVRERTVPPLNRDWSADGNAEWRNRYLAGDPEVLAELRRPGLSHVNEIGTLFVALAGLMNLVVVLDALSFAPRPLPDRRRGASS